MALRLYFSKTDQLLDFAKFTVEQTSESIWTVVGTLKPKPNQIQDQFPVADLSTEQNAKTFAKMCSAIK